MCSYFFRIIEDGSHINELCGPPQDSAMLFKDLMEGESGIKATEPCLLLHFTFLSCVVFLLCATPP
jgi:hypothetical protein